MEPPAKKPRNNLQLFSQEEAKKRGRPTKETPEGFAQVFWDKAFDATTIANKKAHIRSFRAFLLTRAPPITWRKATIEDLFAYGRILAEYGSTTQEILNYITTNRQPMVWHGVVPYNELMAKWSIVWSSLKRMSAEAKTSQAPIILDKKLKEMSFNLQRVLITLMSSGLRVGSLKHSNNNDYFWPQAKEDGSASGENQLSLYVRAIKYIPRDFDRAVQIPCTCSADALDNSSCVPHKLRYINFTNLDWSLLAYELSKYKYTFHSAKRTIAAYCRIAARYYDVKLDVKRLSLLLGWSTAPHNGNQRDIEKMFRYYTKDTDVFEDTSDLPQLYRIFKQYVINE